MEELHFKIKPLDRDNYPQWVVDIKVLLLERNCLGIVEEIEGEPTKETDEKVVKDYKLRKNRAYTTIYINVSPRFRTLIEKTHDPVIAWKALKDYFLPDSRARTLALKNEFYFARPEVDEGIGMYGARLSRIIEQLKESGHPVGEEDQCFQLLRFLPDKFENIVQGIYRWEKPKFVFDKVLEELVCEESRLRQRENDREMVGYMSRITLKDITCYGCGRKGHLKNRCKYLKEQVSHKNKYVTYGEPSTSTGFVNQERNKFPTEDDEDLPVNLHRKRKNRSRPKSQSPERLSRHSSFLLEILTTEKPPSSWVFDSAANYHFCSERDLFDKDYVTVRNQDLIGAVEGSKTPIVGTGSITLYLDNSLIVLRNVYHAPKLRRNLISGPCLDKKGYKYVGQNGKIDLYNKYNEKLCTAYLQDNLYVLNPTYCDEEIPAKIQNTPPKSILKNAKRITNNKIAFSVESLKSWHKRLAHINTDYIIKTSKNLSAHGLNDLKGRVESCEPCKLAKHRRISFKSIDRIRSKKPLELVHTDLCGPMPKESINGHRYLLTITDDYSRKVFVFPLRLKSDVFETFVRFQKRAERFTGLKIKAIRSDNGLEYLNAKFKDYCSETGIVHECTNTFSPEMNGVSERYNYTIADGIKVLLEDSKLSKGFWAEAALYFTYTWNRLCHKHHDKTPFELYGGRKPSLRHTKPFGCRAYLGIPRQRRNKLENRSKRGILVGYALRTKGYRIWLPDEHKITESINVRFEESCFDGDIDPAEAEDSVLDPTYDEQEEIPYLRCSTRSSNIIESDSDSDTDYDTKIEKPKRIRSKSRKTEILDVKSIKSEESSDSSTEGESDGDRESDHELSDESNAEGQNLKSVNWLRNPVPRKTGKRTDIYFYEEGKTQRLRSHKEVKNYCKKNGLKYEKDLFNFSTKNNYKGKIGKNETPESSISKTKTKSPYKSKSD